MRFIQTLISITAIALLTVLSLQVEAQTQIRFWQLQDGSSSGNILQFNGSNWVEIELTGSNVPLADVGGNFTTDDVESALAELAADSHTAVTLNAGNSTALTLSGQELNLSDATLTTNLDIDHLVNLSGAASGSDNYGTVFTGTTIPDNSNIQAALQALETALEASGGTDDQIVDVYTFTATTGIINLSLESDGVGDNTIDIGPVVSRQMVQEQFDPIATATTVTIAGTLPINLSGVRVIRNGLEQRFGAGNDYTIAGSVITFSVAFGTGEQVLVIYAEE